MWDTDVFGLKLVDGALENGETRNAWGFLRGFEEGMETKTDAKEGSILFKILLQRGYKLTGMKLMHSGTEGADAGENELVGGKNVIGSFGPVNVMTQKTNSILQASDVPSTVVENGDKGGFWRRL